MSEKLATGLSFIFHPVWYPVGLLVFYLYANPIAFGLSEPLDDVVMILQTMVICLILPLVSVGVMWKINLIPSLHMDNRMERIGPFIAMMICLLWYYLNIGQYGVAPIYRLYILGVLISLALIFLINLFVKVSVHAAGAAGLLMNLLIASKNFDYSLFIIRSGDSYFQMTFEIIIWIALLILFIVILSRFYLKKHTGMELAGGLILGFFGQVLAVKLIEVI